MSETEKKLTNGQTETIRDLVTPDTQPTAASDDDRSPKKDRDLTTKIGAEVDQPESHQTEIRRDRITPASLEQVETEEDDRSPKKDRDLTTEFTQPKSQETETVRDQITPASLE